MITGDFDKLNQLIQASGAPEDVRLQVAAKMGEWVRKALMKEFWTHEDPYGNIWAPRKQPDRRDNALMVDTATLMTGWVVEISADGIEATNYTPYGVFHQYGTVHMPARKLVPDDEGASQLGEWLEPLLRLATETLEERMFGGVA